jgi:hypothetical protein
MGPWSHGPDEPDDPSARAYTALMTTDVLRWFDYWLKGIDNGVMAGTFHHLKQAPCRCIFPQGRRAVLNQPMTAFWFKLPLGNQAKKTNTRSITRPTAVNTPAIMMRPAADLSNIRTWRPMTRRA